MGSEMCIRDRQGLRVVSGGTENHIVLVDTRSVDEELTGKEAGILLNDRGVTLNRNAIPFDPRSPFITSGIRMGTPAVTTCGMKENELTQVGYLISEIMKNRSDENKLNELEEEVRSLATSFQPYAKARINLEDFGPVSTFSTSILSGLLIGLLIQNFFGYAPWPVIIFVLIGIYDGYRSCLLYTSPSPRDLSTSRMPSSA